MSARTEMSLEEKGAVSYSPRMTIQGWVRARANVVFMGGLLVGMPPQNCTPPGGNGGGSTAGSATGTAGSSAGTEAGGSAGTEAGGSAGTEAGGTATGGTESGGTEAGGTGSSGSAAAGTETGGTAGTGTGGTGGTESGGTESGGSVGTGGASGGSGGSVPVVRFDVSTPNVVKDNLTGLVWQQLPDGSYPALSYPEAELYCSDLEHANFSDWRIPSVQELFSIAQLQNKGNFHDLEAFPNSPADSFWTTDAYSYWGDARHWMVFFASYYWPGQVGMPFALMYDYDEFAYRVRCVRGSAAPAPTPRFVTENGIVLDNLTGREWEQAPSGIALPRAAAQAHCAALDLEGGGWRVPTMHEIVGVSDYSEPFPQSGEPFHLNRHEATLAQWASNAFAEAGGGDWIQFIDGMVVASPTNGPAVSEADVRCIR
jgi:hypothetical protein